jgi:hypothetical protein
MTSTFTVAAPVVVVLGEEHGGFHPAGRVQPGDVALLDDLPRVRDVEYPLDLRVRPPLQPVDQRGKFEGLLAELSKELG